MKVLLATSQKIYLLGLVHVLEACKDIQIVGTACDKYEMDYRLANLIPDVLLMDEVIFNDEHPKNFSQINGRLSRFPIILILHAIDSAIIFKCVHLGIKGLILSADEPDVFPSAIRRVALGDQWMSPPIFAEFYWNLIARIKTPKLRITKREKQLLGYLRKDLTNKDIAKEMSIGERTVEYHIQKMLEKLGVRSRVGITMWAEGKISAESIEPSGF